MHSLTATQDSFGCGSSCLDTVNFRCYLSLVNISMQKSKIIMYSFEIFMEALYGRSRKLCFGPILTNFLCSFFICYLTASRPTLDHYLQDSPTHTILISALNLYSTRRSSKVILPILQQSNSFSGKYISATFSVSRFLSLCKVLEKINKFRKKTS